MGINARWPRRAEWGSRSSVYPRIIVRLPAHVSPHRAAWASRLTPPRELTRPTRSTRATVARLAAAAWIAGAVALGLWALWPALRDFDYRADANASMDYYDRLHGAWYSMPAILEDHGVVEQARRTMPEGAAYGVVIGAGWEPFPRTRWTRSIEEDFLRFYLLPHRQAEPSSAQWIFCLGCDPSTLGGRVEILARGSDGMAFLKVSR